MLNYQCQNTERNTWKYGKSNKTLKALDAIGLLSVIHFED